MGFSSIPIKDGSMDDVVKAREEAHVLVYRHSLERLAEDRHPLVHRLWKHLVRWYSGRHLLRGLVAEGTTYGVRINHAEHLTGEWFGKHIIRADGALWLPAMPNLAVNTGLHMSSQRVLVKTDGTLRTAVAGSTNNGVRWGGVDNTTGAVAATTAQFAGTSFTKQFDADPIYSTTNKRDTALFTITNANFTAVQRRFGLSNDGTLIGANGGQTANTLFSMLAEFILDYNGKAFDTTIESQTDWTGS